MAGTLLAMYIMKDYDIDEERANQIREELDERKTGPVKGTSYQAQKLASLVSSDLDINSKTDIDFTGMTTSEIKAHFAKSLNEGMHGICFSPYLEGQDIGDILTEAQIQKRMAVIAPNTKWVRSFSCTDGNEHIPRVAKEEGLQTMVGAWIGHDKKQNKIEIENLIKLALDGFVDIAVVGNEVLLRDELSEKELLDYIAQVKAALPNIPVGYVDAYYQFNESPKLVDAVDVVLANCYPFWEGSSIDYASTYLKQMHAVTKAIAKEKPVIITETGWPNSGDTSKGAVPSTENAMKYFINANNWAKVEGIDMFYFSSFDESWKVHHEGDVGERWGLWDKNENLKY
jgi:GPH family glycoside/pentoside/hexuronide:cation symporter